MRGCEVRGRCLFVCYQKPQTALKLLPTARVLVFGFGFRSGIAKVLKWASMREREREGEGCGMEVQLNTGERCSAYFNYLP